MGRERSHSVSKTEIHPGRAFGSSCQSPLNSLPHPLPHLSPLLSYRQQKSLGLWISEHFPMPRSSAGVPGHQGSCREDARPFLTCPHQLKCLAGLRHSHLLP